MKAMERSKPLVDLTNAFDKLRLKYDRNVTKNQQILTEIVKIVEILNTTT